MTATSEVLGPDAHPKTIGTRLRSLKKSLTTREGLLGSYDYALLFTPSIPFLGRPVTTPPFFGLDDKMPWLLAILLGFQHTLAMLAGVITPAIILSGAGGLNLDPRVQQYLVSTSLIVCGILSAVQITRFRILKTPYHIGTGLISVVGTSFAIIPVASGGFAQMYANGFCKLGPNGEKLPCPDAYGALIGTAAVCSLVEIALSFIPPKALQKIFPPIVTGPTVMLIGVSLVEVGFTTWAGGSGPCSAEGATGFFAKCPNIAAKHALPWGSAEYIGKLFSHATFWSTLD